MDISIGFGASRLHARYVTIFPSWNYSDTDREWIKIPYQVDLKLVAGCSSDSLDTVARIRQSPSGESFGGILQIVSEKSATTNQPIPSRPGTEVSQYSF
jgi:hypothetical protein